MSDEQNFYTSGGTLGRQAKSYVTRRADKDLLTHLLGGDFCYVLTSRQMGKSSLMVRTANSLRTEGVKVAILDLTRIGQNVSLEQWYDGLLVRLGSELGLEDELDEYWASDRVARLGPMQRFMGALREIVLHEVKGKVSIFIDEIDAVRSLPFSSDEFFAGIRECYNSRVNDPEFKRISFCLLGVAQPSDLISNVYITPFNIGHRIELTDFSEEEAHPLLEGLRQKTERPKDAQAILHRILYWTGGHPYLTQKLCETVVGLQGKVTPKEVDLACKDMFLSSRSREQQDNLIFVRDRVLASKEHRSAILDLYERVRRGERVRDDDSNATIDPLRLSGLLVVRNGYLKVRNRIYATVFDRKWIIANMPDAELRRQKAAYRRGIVLALGISLPVLAIILLLGVLDWREERNQIRESFFADTASAQQAFNIGDFATGQMLIKPWGSEGSAHEDRWTRLKHFWQGREGLEDSFAIRLLRAESAGASHAILPSQHAAAGDGPTTTACDAEIAVATSTFKQLPLIAAAGADSSVQLWRSDKDPMEPVAHLQLTLNDNGGLSWDSRSPLRSCEEIAKMASNLPGIMALAFSPDGSKLAIATGTWRNARSAGGVLLWDMAHPDQIQNLPVKFEKTVDSLQFTDDGNYLAASSEDATVEMWQIANGIANNLIVIDPRNLIAPDGGSVGGSGAHVVTLATPEHLMAVGYGDGHLVIYDYLHPQRPRYVGLAHVSGIMSMVFLEQKDKPLRLVVGSRDGDLLLFDPNELMAAYQKGGGHLDRKAARNAVKLTLQPRQGVLQGLAAGYENDHSEVWLLVSGGDGTVGLWSITPNFHLLATLNGHTAGVHAATFCQTKIHSEEDTGCIVSASSDHDVRLWKHPFRNRESADTHLAEHGLLFPGQMIGVAFAQNGSAKIVTAVGATTEENRPHSGVVAMWDYASNPVKEPEEYEPSSIQVPMLGFDVSPDGKFVVSTSRNRNLEFVDLTKSPDAHADRQSIPVHVTLNPRIRVRCMSDDGKTILAKCATDQREYLIAGVADRADIPDNQYDTGRGLCTWRVVDQGRAAVPRFSIVPGLNPCVSPRSTVSLTQKEQDFRDIAQRVGSFAISEMGDLIVTSSDAGVRTCVEIWKAEDLLTYGSPDASRSTRDCLNRKDGFSNFGGGFDAQFAAISFSPDGNYIAATNINSGLYYWPIEKTISMPIGQPYGLGARGQALAFSPHGLTLAIGLQDSRIVLWNTMYARKIMELDQHRGGVLGLAFSPDGDTLASAGNDGLVTVIQAEPLVPQR